MPVVTQVQVRRGTAAQWTSANPVLASGEQGFETDTLKLKIGNGSTAWNSLAYVATGATGTVTSVVAGTGLSGGTITSTGTIAIDSTVATLTGTQALTNKTINGSSNTITNVSLTSGVTGTLPVANGGTGITSLGSGVATFLGTPSSANLAAALTDETGTGVAVFNDSPTILNPVITQPQATPTFSANAYTLVAGDAGDILLASNGATAGTINIPTDATTNFAIGTQITILQVGTGQITVQATTSGTTTVRSTGATAISPKCRAQYSAMTIWKQAANLWYAFGDIS
jgi:hypothetical protein